MPYVNIEIAREGATAERKTALIAGSAGLLVADQTTFFAQPLSHTA